jgi:hypothetical protein
MSPAELYDRDFYEWTVRNTELLRSGRATDADLEHIAEEIEDMGRREFRDLRSRLKVLMTHLLKWKVQPGHRSHSWELTIRVQRVELEELLSENPSLRPRLERDLPKMYQLALADAIIETRLPESDFPSTCPFPLEVLLDPEYLP